MIRETTYDHLHESQTQYRMILDAMSKPGVIHTLSSQITPPAPMLPASAIVGMVLMNSDVTFFQCFDSLDVENYFIINTAASPSPVDEADFIFMSGLSPNGESIDLAKPGFPEYPEHGAFIVIDTMEISEAPSDIGVKLNLKGPGVKGEKEVYIVGLSTLLLDSILDKNQEYPLGVDTILTDKNGHILCIPRSNSFTYQAL